MENFLTDEDYEKFHQLFVEDTLKRFWISWYQPTEDYRPIYPKGDKEPLGHLYWCTGERADGASTMCAVVDAKDESEAKLTIKKYWPEANEWRFCEERPYNWLPGSDRFPKN